ncbi:MAG: PilN domain-containing protein, partial [Deltaproteobacteria bacterium]|nr:PilN domain-containing protein [Deltaproteobacteria bacterium]
AFFSAWLDVRSVAKLELRKAEQAQRLKELKAQVPGPAKGQVLAREIEALTKEVRVRERLYEVIVPGTGGNIEGFSSYLEGLARQRIHGVWLQTIRINEGGDDLMLVGHTLEPDGVPNLLEKLRNEPAFKGRDFRRLLLERASKESNAVRFTISTHEGAG